VRGRHGGGREPHVTGGTRDRGSLAPMAGHTRPLGGAGLDFPGAVELVAWTTGGRIDDPPPMRRVGEDEVAGDSRRRHARTRREVTLGARRTWVLADGMAPPAGRVPLGPDLFEGIGLLVAVGARACRCAARDVGRVGKDEVRRARALIALARAQDEAAGREEHGEERPPGHLTKVSRLHGVLTSRPSPAASTASSPRSRMGSASSNAAQSRTATGLASSYAPLALSSNARTSVTRARGD
jgi:hypothetical protein